MASTTPARIPLGVVFVILLLSSPRRRQRRHAVHGPSSGVVLARSLAAAVVQRQHGSLRSCVRGGNCYCMSPRRLQRQHGPSGVVSAVVVVMHRFTPR